MHYQTPRCIAYHRCSLLSQLPILKWLKLSHNIQRQSFMVEIKVSDPNLNPIFEPRIRIRNCNLDNGLGLLILMTFVALTIYFISNVADKNQKSILLFLNYK